MEVQQHPLSKPANSSFTLLTLYNYSNTWILVFAKCGLCSLSSLELKYRSAGRRNKGKILKTPTPMLWHCFSSTVIVPRNRNTPPSLLATSAAVQNPKATALAEWREQLGHHHPYIFPFREALTFLWKL